MLCSINQTTTYVDPNRCNEKPIPVEGEFICENMDLIVGTKCQFICPADKVPILDEIATCKEVVNPGSSASTFEWDKSMSSFECVKVIRY